MTATIDTKTMLVSQLINSCYTTQQGYRSAASAVEDQTLKRLFEIYAQQRTRFAEELRQYLPEADGFDLTGAGVDVEPRTCARADKNTSIRECIEMDARNLALYREALAHRTLPTRTHLTISAQLALMERVHDRMNLMLAERRNDRPPLRVSFGRVSA
ncbi:MAG TPA: DUF2383 domain-containing protein [Verrucomicrobiae bacterium]